MSVVTRRRIYWTKEQKRQILDEAARLHLKNPKKNHLWLIREAQKVLDVANRRNLSMVSWKGAFAWFVKGFEDAVNRTRRNLAEVKNKEQQIAPEEIKTPPSEEITPSLMTFFSKLTQMLEEFKKTTVPKQELPIGIVGRLDQLQEKLNRLEARVEEFFENGFVLMPAGAARRTEAAPLPSPAITADGTGFATSTILTTPPPETPTTRKPRVMVLNTDSGHVRNGIQKGTQGCVSQLNFTDSHELRTPPFGDFDYVLAYKKTPVPWIQAAKKFYPAGKFHAVSGGAESMVAAIKKLPLIDLIK